MALPKITVATHSLKLPISGKKIKIRPFLVKEEKIIMMAIESDDPEELSDIIFELINNCVQTANFKAEDLSLLDMQYVLVKLRAMSKGDKVDITVKCNNNIPNADDEDTHKCGHLNELVLNLDDLQLSKKYTSENNKIKISDTVGIKLKPIDSSLLTVLAGKDTNVSTISIDSIASCIESVWSGDEVILFKDESKKDRDNFVDSLSSDIIKKMEDYLKNLPRLIIKVEFACEVCGYTETIEVDNIKDFFQ